MKIFMIASLHGRKKFLPSYRRIVEAVESTGNKVDADHILNVSKNDLDSWNEDQNLKYHKRILKKIKSCDVLIAEMSFPSTSIGFLLAEGVEKSKPVIMLFNGEKEPHLLPTLESYERLQLISYTDSTDLNAEMKYALDYASDQQDTRFNFFVSPKISHYLEWVSKTKRLPRAVYLRKLIEEHMSHNEEYQDS